MSRKNVLVVPSVPLYKKLFSEAADAHLLSLANVAYNETEADWTGADLARRIAEADILLTSWRNPKLTPELLDLAPRLKLVAHSAGSVKFMIDDSIFCQGIQVSTAGAAMVPPVAETTVLLCMLMLRPVYKLDEGLRSAAPWFEMKLAGVGDELGTKTVGIIGAGQIGKRVIKMLRAWEIDVRLFDPYISPEQAAAMDVTAYHSLQDMLPHCDIVTLHAPVLPETRHLMGGEELRRMRDGTILINTARAWLVDHDALAAELKQGRLRYATDVFENEPLPRDDAWRTMPNTFILPHIAAATRQCFHRQGDITGADVSTA